MSRVQKSITLFSSSVEAVNNLVPEDFNFSEKIDTIAQDCNSLVRYTKSELLNYFTLDEANLILDSTNGLIYSSQIPPALSLQGNVADSIDFYQLDKKWNVDKDTLLNKILKLTAFQAYVVHLMSREVWNSEDPNKANVKDIFMIRE